MEPWVSGYKKMDKGNDIFRMTQTKRTPYLNKMVSMLTVWFLTS